MASTKPNIIINPGTKHETWLFRQLDGSYKDIEGTTYPEVLFEEKRAGLDTLWALRLDDPYSKEMAKEHDHDFDQLEAGYPDKEDSALSVSNKLAVSGAKVMLNEGIKPIFNGLKVVAEGLVVIPVGYVVGGLMYAVKKALK